MNIVGRGQLAKAFSGIDIDSVFLFASGVSNSNCKNIEEFDREESLLKEKLVENGDKKFVYFSSCALSAGDYEFNDYYRHKLKMEQVVKEKSKHYFIFRLPQLFGCLTKHPTLINFIYDAIKSKKQFDVFDDAYRYVIEIEDVKTIVISYLNFYHSSITVDLANPYRYRVMDIVKIFERLLGEQAIYKTISKSDKYILNLDELKIFMKRYELNLNFGKDYLEDKLQEKLCEIE